MRRIRQFASIGFNTVLQIIGDPRWWPRELPRSKEKLFWRQPKQADGHWPPADHTVRLRGLANAQFSEAKFWYLGVTYLYVAAAILVCLAFASPNSDGDPNVGLTLAAIICQVFAATARLRAIRLHSFASLADWRELVMDGMGPTDAEKQHAMALEGVFADGARKRAGPLSNYYASARPEGEQRLIDNLRETAFYTQSLYETAYTRAFYFAAAVVFIPVLPLAESVVTNDVGEDVRRELFVLAVTAVLPLLDIIFRLRAWRGSADMLTRVVDGLRTVTELRHALPFLTDAVVATATAPPIPRRVYDTNAGELQERWRQIAGQALAKEDDEDEDPLTQK
ncbi:MAG TPA: hypothetical protein VHF90_03045 [Thermoleophilaceae bacterium]|nr:hypothetical protein [Thermoleophilaceae bacterium]